MLPTLAKAKKVDAFRPILDRAEDGPFSRRPLSGWEVPRKSGPDEVNPLSAEHRNGAPIANPRGLPQPAYHAAVHRAPPPSEWAIGVDRIDSAEAEEEQLPHNLKNSRYLGYPDLGHPSREIA